MSSRIHPNVVFRKESPNQSSRNGAKPRLIIVHSTEGDNVAGTARDLIGVAGYLCQPNVQASSHVLVDSDGYSARIVADDRKAWTQAWWNPWGLSIEQVGRAAQTTWAREELRESARWIARWSLMYGIPPYKGAVDLESGRILKVGVVRHSELGVRGGGHHDPGPSYPLDETLALARFYRAKLK
jgi:hypothetical protein